MVADQLSRIVLPNSIEHSSIHDTFPDEQSFSVSKLPWLVDITNYLVTSTDSEYWGQKDKKKFLVEVRKFFWDDPYLFK